MPQPTLPSSLGSGPSGVHVLVRRAHEERVLQVLRERSGLSRSDLAARVGLSRTTMSEITGDLLARGVIVVVDNDRRRTGSGRRAELLALDPRSGQFLGVDFGHARVRFAVADAAHEIIARGIRRYANGLGWADRFALAFDLIDSITHEAGIGLSALQGVGVGVTGPLPTSTSSAGVDVRRAVVEAFGDRYRAPVVVDNNTRFAAVAEALTGPNAHDVVYVRLADGVGGGLIVGGRLVGGGRGIAGEIGHVNVRRNGAPCRCGKRGCLETLASLPAVLAACRDRGAMIADAQALTAAIESGQPHVRAVLDDAGAALGIVLAGAAVVLDPTEIVIGGALAEATPHLIDIAQRVVHDEVIELGGGPPAVRAARLGDEDGALGAVAVLFQNHSQLLAEYADALPVPAVDPSADHPTRGALGA